LPEILVTVEEGVKVATVVVAAWALVTRSVSTAMALDIGQRTVLMNETRENATTAVNMATSPEIAGIRNVSLQRGIQGAVREIGIDTVAPILALALEIDTVALGLLAALAAVEVRRKHWFWFWF